MAVSCALRTKAVGARASVSAGFLDAATTFEYQVIVDGKNLRRVAGSSDIIDLVVVNDSTNTKGTLRLAGQGTGVMHVQFRYRTASGYESVTLLSVPPAAFYDWRKYAFVCGVDGSDKWLHIAEWLDDGTYRFAQNAGDLSTSTSRTAAASGSLSGCNYIFASTTGDDPGIGLAAAFQGPFTYYGVAFRTGSDVLGGSATAAQCFSEPTSSTADLYFKFDNGDGATVSSTVTGYGTSASDLTLGGTHRTDWLSLGRNDRPNFTSLPDGAYIANGTELTFFDATNVAYFHSIANNTASGADPELGWEDNRFNVFDDVFQCVVRVRTAPSGWFSASNPGGGTTFALRDDLGGGGGTWMLQIQVGYDTAGGGAVQKYCQYRKGVSTVLRSPAAPDFVTDPATEGDYIYSIEGDGVGGVTVQVALLGNGSPPQSDWEVLFTDSSGWLESGIGYTHPLGGLDWRSQSKNRTGGTSTFDAGEFTALESFGSANLVVWGGAASPVLATKAVHSEHHVATPAMPWTLHAEHGVAVPGIIAQNVLAVDHMLAVLQQDTVRSEHRLAAVAERDLLTERVGRTLRSDALNAEHLATTATVTATDVVHTERIGRIVAQDVVHTEHEEAAPVPVVPVSGTMVVVWGI